MKLFRSSKNQRGSTMLEFAFSIPVFLLLLIGLIDLGRVSYTAVAMQFALNKAGRFISVGQLMTDPNDPTVTLNRLQSLQTKISEIGSTYGVSFETGDMRFCLVNNPDCTTDTIAGSGGFFTITIQKNVPMIFNSIDLPLRQTILVKNEAF